MKYFRLFKCKSFINKGTRTTHVPGETFVQLAKAESVPSFPSRKAEVGLARKMILLVILPPSLYRDKHTHLQGETHGLFQLSFQNSFSPSVSNV